MAEKEPLVHSSEVDRNNATRNSPGTAPCGQKRSRGLLLAGVDSGQITCPKCLKAS